MSDVDEAVKRLEDDCLSVEARTEPGEHWRDIRTVLDALSIHQRGIVDLTELAGRFQRERDEALAVIERAKSWNTHDAHEPQFWDLQHVLNTSPVDALRERDAEKWDECVAMVRNMGRLDERGIQWLSDANPYRKEQS